MIETVDFKAVYDKLKPRCQELIAQYPDSRSALLPILHEFQNELGWVSPEAMEAAGGMLGLPVSVVESTASFYSLFFKRPVGKYMVQPCRGLACIVGGAEDAMKYLRDKLGVQHLQTTDDGVFSYEEVECLAACDRAPCMQVNLEFVYDLTPESMDKIIADMKSGACAIKPRPQTTRPGKTWHVSPETGKKSPGAQHVEDPNAPGGIGDVTGVRMLQRLEKDPRPIQIRPTSERLITDVRDVSQIENGVPKH